MKKEDLTKIELSGNEYFLACNMNVLEEIQDAFGSVVDFEKAMAGRQVDINVIDPESQKPVKVKGQEPSFKHCKFALCVMAREGAAIAGKKAPTDREIIDNCDVTIFELYPVLNAEFSKCFQRKSKNDQTT